MKTMTRISHAAFALIFCALTFAIATPGATAHDSHAHGAGGAGHGKSIELGTSAAFDPAGRLWAVMKESANDEQFVVLQSSADSGKTWSSPIRVQKKAEPVAANGEARPHIAFGPKGEMYLTYTKPIAKPHIGEIRFVKSLDGGKTFSEPITVHANREVITHSFESMVVDREGRIYVTWIDGRGAAQAKARKEPYAGSAVYYAVSSDGGNTFKGDYKIADHSCECCRIAMTLDPQGKPAVMWRHVFEPNIRDHALATLSSDGSVSPVMRVTFDDWRIDACPHHGPSVAYAADGTRHQVWFNGKEGKGGGALYAMASPSGSLSEPMTLGSEQASHPDLAVQGSRVAVVWKQFDGTSTAILAKLSVDGGATWSEKEMGRTTGDSDKPHLITGSSEIVLIWRTQKEGIRTASLFKEKV